MNLDDIIAVDFGSTNSAVFVFRHGRLEQLANNETTGEYQFPSFVEYTKNSVVTGLTAKRHLGNEGHFVVACVKRLIGLTYDEYERLEDRDIFGCEVVRGDDGYPQFIVSDEGRKVGCIEVAAEIFKKIKSEADSFCDHEVTSVYLTVPVKYNEAQTLAIKEASRMAGLKIVRTMKEPIAAALSLCVDHPDDVHKTERLLIFDFGGGTFDVSCLECKDATHFEICCCEGEACLGGNDFDTAILKYALERYKQQTGNDLLNRNPKTYKKKFNKLRGACEEIKKTISTHPTSELDVDDRNEVTISITEADVEQAIRNKLNMAMKCVRRITDKDGYNPGQIRHVVFVGGSSKLNIVRKAVKRMFGNSNFPDVDAYSCVAKGAGYLAQLDSRPISIPQPIYHSDCSYGIEGGNKVLILLRIGQKIPCDTGAVTVELTDKTTKEIKSTLYRTKKEMTKEARILMDINECEFIGNFSIPVPSSTERYEMLLHVEDKEVVVICKSKITKDIVGRYCFNLN